MRIAHIVTRLLRAGSEENTVQTCRWQVEHGHNVTLVHGPDPDPWWTRNLPAGITLREVPQMVHSVQPLMDIRALWALRQVYRDIRPDVIHTHQSKAGILGRLAASVVPDAIVTHGIHIVPFEHVSPVTRALYVAAEKWAARKTDVFIGVSEAVGRAYVEAGITPPDRVHCVRSGMDLARFETPQRPDDWRTLLGVPTGGDTPLVVLMMAAFEPRKRHVSFLRAFAKDAAALPNFKLLLAGAGPEEANVRAAVTALGLEDKVVFCGHRTDPEALFALADVSILTSAREGLPRVVVQSIASGCPVLVQNLPGLEEIIDHGRNGWIAPGEDMDRTAQQLVRLLSDPTLRARLRAGALATDLSAWRLDALGAQTTALYGL
ncbi:MAG: glycosyltransferase, partial [Pseudomonadota bacterium]